MPILSLVPIFFLLASAPPASPVPSIHGCTNEPPGFEEISDEPFDEVPPAHPRKDEHGWYVRNRGDLRRLEVERDPLLGNALRGTFPEGMPGGRGPFGLINRFGREYRALYMCIEMKLDARWTNNHNAATKWGFFLTPYDQGARKLNHYFNLANRLGIQLQSGSKAALNRNAMSRFLTTGNLGRWLRVEIMVRGNSPGRADGIAQMWVDGHQVLNEFNIRYFFPEQQAAFSGVTWNPTYGGGHNPVPYDMHQWIAHWYISGQ